MNRANSLKLLIALLLVFLYFALDGPGFAMEAVLLLAAPLLLPTYCGEAKEVFAQRFFKGLGIDFCPFCRDLSWGKVDALVFRNARQTGPATSENEDSSFPTTCFTCHGCNATLNGRADEYAGTLRKEPSDETPLPKPIHVVHLLSSGSVSGLIERMEWEQSASSEGFAFRQEVLLEPLKRISYWVDEALAMGGRFLDAYAYGCLLPFVFLIVSTAVATSVLGKDEPAFIGPFFLFMTLLSLFLFVFFRLDSRRRFVILDVLPLAAKGLRPLKPTKEEIDRLFEHLQQEDAQIVAYVSADELFREISKTQETGPVGTPASGTQVL